MRNQTQKCDAQQLFAANMRRIRHEKKLTQEKVAEVADLHPNYVSSVERGERNISICNIARIALALGVCMEALVALPLKNSYTTHHRSDLIGPYQLAPWDLFFGK